MRVIEISPGAFGIEPDSETDRIGSLTPEELRELGASEETIARYIAYRDRYYLEDGK